jgi:hypothetical protein
MTDKIADTMQKRDEQEKLVLMYPGNQLKDQIRPFAETLSAFHVMKETFFTQR